MKPLDKKQTLSRVTDLIVLILSLVLLAGIHTVFSACGPKEDGSFMTCHWAEQAVFGFSLLLMALSLILTFYRGKGRYGVKTGLYIAILAAGLVCALVPGVFIRLCMMETMRCHVVMRPAVLLICALLAVTSVIGCVSNRKQCGIHHAQQAEDPEHAV